MRPTPVVSDARLVPSIAEQLRAARHRRERRRRVTLAALVVVPATLLGARLVAAPAVLLGARLVAGASAEPSRSDATTTTPIAPTTSSVPTGLNPGLVGAFGRAKAEAADAGHELTITSGFRTAEEQAAMLEAEVAERGSLEEALWWVFPPDRSMHVQGLAIDVGDGPAADWLADEGARFGLCRTLSWEWWHFEWRERWEVAGACPAPAQVPDDAPPA
ncbi:MAG: zinc D-Ala-D-Ala carboxypeptidase [Nocardioidaceae bacterium]|nr:zinc D-Ala-D-Ala carboxypeptidase [Nocardioidaceae bacterium]